MEKGGLISIEGIDGAGKSRQAERLGKSLSVAGVDNIVTFEPGGGVGGEPFYQLLAGKSLRGLGAATEALLFTAARRHHLDSLILPAMENGKIVITDRFVDSTRVYQGFNDAQLARKIDQLHDLMIGIEPDLTIVIDIPVETALQRVHQRSGGDTRLESFGEKLEELRERFIAIAQANPHRCSVVDGDRDEHHIAAEILVCANELLS
ncbi:MAG: dTMP kinase [Rhodobacteraceae bacterium]|nr:dTMP kinase [Paracoccaceae bacterium]MCY4198118.1 dTMP kinase [Paracoccaceae bacterium]